MLLFRKFWALVLPKIPNGAKFVTVNFVKAYVMVLDQFLQKEIYVGTIGRKKAHFQTYRLPFKDSVVIGLIAQSDG